MTTQPGKQWPQPQEGLWWTAHPIVPSSGWCSQLLPYYQESTQQAVFCIKCKSHPFALCTYLISYNNKIQSRSISTTFKGLPSLYFSSPFLTSFLQLSPCPHHLLWVSQVLWIPSDLRDQHILSSGNTLLPDVLLAFPFTEVSGYMPFSNEPPIMLISRGRLYYLHDTPHYLKLLTINLSACLFMCLSPPALEGKLHKIKNQVSLVYPVPCRRLVIYRDSTAIS